MALARQTPRGGNTLALQLFLLRLGGKKKRAVVRVAAKLSIIVTVPENNTTNKSWHILESAQMKRPYQTRVLRCERRWWRETGHGLIACVFDSPLLPNSCGAFGRSLTCCCFPRSARRCHCPAKCPPICASYRSVTLSSPFARHHCCVLLFLRRISLSALRSLRFGGPAKTKREPPQLSWALKCVVASSPPLTTV